MRSEEGSSSHTTFPPKPRAKPWRSDPPIRERDNNKDWNDSSPHKTKDCPQKMSAHALLLYAIRSILVGGLLGAFSSIGLLSDQPSHLGAVLHLFVAENATVSIMYDNAHRSHIQRLARRRGAGAYIAR